MPNNEIERIAEIKQRLEKATNWPWQVEDFAEAAEWPVCFPGTSNIDGKKYQVSTDGVHAFELFGDAKTDAEFIANAPADIEYLLAALSEMRTVALREAAKIAIGEKVDYAATKDGGDEAYNLACEHIQAAILGRIDKC